MLLDAMHACTHAHAGLPAARRRRRPPPALPMLTPGTSANRLGDTTARASASRRLKHSVSVPDEERSTALRYAQLDGSASSAYSVDPVM